MFREGFEEAKWGWWWLCDFAIRGEDLYICGRLGDRISGQIYGLPSSLPTGFDHYPTIQPGLEKIEVGIIFSASSFDIGLFYDGDLPRPYTCSAFWRFIFGPWWDRDLGPDILAEQR